MISAECIDAYNKSGLEGQCFYRVPNCMPVISFPDGRCYTPMSKDNNDETFAKLLAESVERGRSLFELCWRPLHLERDPNIIR